MKKLPVLAAVAGAIALSACVSGPRGVAPSNVPLTPGEYESRAPVSHEYCERTFLGFIRLNSKINMETLVNAAIAKAPGANALAGITYDTSGWSIGIYAVECTTVRGTAVAQ